MNSTTKMFDIKVCIVGEKSSGRKSLSKLLFLGDTQTPIKVEPLSKLGQEYTEIVRRKNKQRSSDRANLQEQINQSKNHNFQIMQQTEIKSIADLRNNGIDPFFRKTLTNEIFNPFFDPAFFVPKYGSAKYPKIPANLNMRYQFIGDNYMDFIQEIEAADILVYVTDQEIDGEGYNESELFKTIKGTTFKPDSCVKHLFIIINKSDDILRDNEQTIFDTDVRMSNDCITVMHVSLYWAYALRLASHGCFDLIDKEKLAEMVNAFPRNSRIKEMIVSKKSSRKSLKRYLTYLDNSGYNLFRGKVNRIICQKVRNIISNNFKRNVRDFERDLDKLHDQISNALSRSIISNSEENDCSAIYIPDSYYFKISHLIKDAETINSLLENSDQNIVIQEMLTKHLDFIYDHMDEIISSVKGCNILNSIMEIDEEISEKSEIYNSIQKKINSLQKKLMKNIEARLENIDKNTDSSARSDEQSNEQLEPLLTVNRSSVILQLENLIEYLIYFDNLDERVSLAQQIWSKYYEACNNGQSMTLKYFHTFTSKYSKFDIVYHDIISHIRQNRKKDPEMNACINLTVQYILTKCRVGATYCRILPAIDGQILVRYFFQLMAYLSARCLKSNQITIFTYLRLACEEILGMNGVKHGTIDKGTMTIDYIDNNLDLIINNPNELIENESSIIDNLSKMLEAKQRRTRSRDNDDDDNDDDVDASDDESSASNESIESSDYSSDTSESSDYSSDTSESSDITESEISSDSSESKNNEQSDDSMSNETMLDLISRYIDTIGYDRV